MPVRYETDEERKASYARNNEHAKKNRARYAQELQADPSDPRHGTSKGYAYGCRCEMCVEEYRKYRKQIKRKPESNKICKTVDYAAIKRQNELGFKVGDFIYSCDGFPWQIIGMNTRCVTCEDVWQPEIIEDVPWNYLNKHAKKINRKRWLHGQGFPR